MVIFVFGLLYFRGVWLRAMAVNVVIVVLGWLCLVDTVLEVFGCEPWQSMWLLQSWDGYVWLILF